jgi:hypothetical protein
MLTVLTLFSAVVLTLMILVLVRPSRENLISIRSESPSESRNNRGRELLYAGIPPADDRAGSSRSHAGGTG